MAKNLKIFQIVSKILKFFKLFLKFHSQSLMYYLYTKIYRTFKYMLDLWTRKFTKRKSQERHSQANCKSVAKDQILAKSTIFT